MAKAQVQLPTADRIGAVALDILEREGAEAVSMRRVASEVGITAMAIYHHFPSRDELLHHVSTRAFDQLLERMRDREQDSLTDLLEAYIDYALEHPLLVDYVFARERPGMRKFPEDFEAGKSPTLNVVADRITKRIKAGDWKRDDVWELAFQMWALTHGYVALYRAGRIGLSEKKFRALWRRAFKRLIDGLEA